MRTIALATAAAVTLIVVYLALGGASYSPAKVADPCLPRAERRAQGVGGVAERVVLSAIDGAACKLGVSRESIVLAFANRASLRSFARQHHITERRLEELLRAGLLQAVDEAERTGALDSTVADLVRGLVRRVPVGGLLDLLQQLPG
jgi:hypothetical protein